MNVIIDGIIFQHQNRGGISRVFQEIIPRVCDLDPEINITMFTSGRCMQSLPRHERLHHYPPAWLPPLLIPNRVWQPLIKMISDPGEKYLNSDSRNAIWHSTYYTHPIEWKGKEVVTVHDTIHERFPTIYKGDENDNFRKRKRICIERADKIICDSTTTMIDVKTFYCVDPDKLCVITLSASEIFRLLESLEVKVQINQPYLIYVGGRYGYKNFDNFIRAYANWVLRKDISLVLVGNRLNRNEHNLINNVGITKQVLHFGKLNDKKLCELYNNALAFVHPSLYEGFGIPLLEAMACGCPIVASRIPSTVEVAGDVPIYFEPSDHDSIIDALNKVVMGDEVSEKTRLGLERAKRYSWDRSARLTLDVYRSLINPDHQAALV